MDLPVGWCSPNCCSCQGRLAEGWQKLQYSVEGPVAHCIRVLLASAFVSCSFPARFFIHIQTGSSNKHVCVLLLLLCAIGTYPEVISVAAVDCNNRLAPFSQKHASVDISAPGVDILSTASRQLASKAGMVKAAFRVDSGPRFMTSAGIGGTHSQIRWSGLGSTSGVVADCGDGTKPCPAAKGNICMVQWDPKMKTAAATPARASGGSSMRGRLLRWVNSVTQGPGGASGIPTPAVAGGSSLQQAMPTRFTCDLMEYCIQQGAKGALLAAPAPSSGYYPEWGWTKTRSGEPEFAEWPFFANLKCTAYNCSCWERLKGSSILPAAGLTLKQYTDLKATLKSSKDVKGTIESQVGVSLVDQYSMHARS